MDKIAPGLSILLIVFAPRRSLRLLFNSRVSGLNKSIVDLFLFFSFLFFSFRSIQFRSVSFRLVADRVLSYRVIFAC